MYLYFLYIYKSYLIQWSCSLFFFVWRFRYFFSGVVSKSLTFFLYHNFFNSFWVMITIAFFCFNLRDLVTRKFPDSFNIFILWALSYKFVLIHIYYIRSLSFYWATFWMLAPLVRKIHFWFLNLIKLIHEYFFKLLNDGLTKIWVYRQQLLILNIL